MPKTKGKSPHITVKIPKSLTDEIDLWMGKMGFTSRGEFVKEAVRKLLLEYQKERDRLK